MKLVDKQKKERGVSTVGKQLVLKTLDKETMHWHRLRQSGDPADVLSYILEEKTSKSSGNIRTSLNSSKQNIQHVHQTHFWWQMYRTLKKNHEG